MCRYCAIVNPIRRHVADLSAKPLTILTASLIWVLAIVLAMPAALFSHVPTVPLQGNHSILICSPFPEEFGEYCHSRFTKFAFHFNPSERRKASPRHRLITESLKTYDTMNANAFEVSRWSTPIVVVITQASS